MIERSHKHWRVGLLLQLAADSASVALDAWLEEPLTCDHRDTHGPLFRPLTSEQVNARLGREEKGPVKGYTWYGEHESPEERHERAIRYMIKLLADAAYGIVPNDWWSPDARKLVTPKKYLDLVYQLRIDTDHHFMRQVNATFGVRDPIHVLGRQRLIAAVREVERRLREAWEEAALTRAVASARAPTEHQAKFLAWIRQQNRPVSHVEVKQWCAVQRGRPADYNWGATDPAGPLLRRFCEKQGAPGSRAKWVLRAEAS